MTTETTEYAATGQLRWNIKQSFRDYVGELPDGEETWIGSVGGIDSGDLVFPSAGVSLDLQAPTDGLTLKFSGAVRYAGYRGMLRVDLSDPWITLGPGDEAELSANIATSGLPERRTVIAKVSGRPPRTDQLEWDWTTETTSLSASGAQLLGSVYPPGTEAAGFALHVSRR